MKNPFRQFLEINTIAILLTLSCLSCSETKAVSATQLKTESKTGSLTIEEQINKSMVSLGSSSFIKKFVEEIWKCNLPEDSTKALTVGYSEVEKTTGSSDDEKLGYTGKYGFTSRIVVKNSLTEIEYWEKTEKSIIWRFRSSDAELSFLDIKPISMNLKDLTDRFGSPSKVKGNQLQYLHKDFYFSFTIENGICNSMEFSREI